MVYSGRIPLSNVQLKTKERADKSVDPQRTVEHVKVFLGTIKYCCATQPINQINNPTHHQTKHPQENLADTLELAECAQHVLIIFILTTY